MIELDYELKQLVKTNFLLKKSVKLIKKLARENNSTQFYKEHFIPCADICYKMSYIKKIDAIDAIIVGLFHDIGKFMLKNKVDNHEIVGAEFTEKFLIDNKYDTSRISKIKQAIIDHRKNANDNLDTMSKLVIDADIISYIIHKKYFYNYLLDSHSTDEANKIVNKKIIESYDRLDDDGKNLIAKLLSN